MPDLRSGLKTPFGHRPAIFLSVLLGWALGCFCLLVGSTAEAALPAHFQQEPADEPIRGLRGASIGDIRWSGHYLWVATENGVARLDPSRFSGLAEEDWVTYTERNGLGRGGPSALAAVGDTVWVATISDTTTSRGDFQAGNGLSFSPDAGQTWYHLANEAIFDTARAEFKQGPSTPINNGCFGLSITGSTIWATFFSGSSVRSRDSGRTWERVLPDGADEIVFSEPNPAADSLWVRSDSLALAGAPAAEIDLLRAQADSLVRQTLLHRTFSVLAYGDTVWIGTSSGLARSFDNGRTWKNIRVRRDREGQVIPDHIAGNWVVALRRQLRPDGTAVIWAGTDRTTTPGEVSAISFSRDHGETWEITGPTFAWDFAFTATRVWASTNLGLLASADQGGTWELVQVEDPFIREELRGVFVGLETVGDTLWVGAENGLGFSVDEGQTWRIVKALVKTPALDTGGIIGTPGPEDDTSPTYAAPNPFAPAQGEQTRIVYSLARNAQVSIKIYDFASRLVRTLIEDEAQAGPENYGRNWDGRDDDGDPAANGVYFYRVELGTGEQAFGKVVLLD